MRQLGATLEQAQRNVRVADWDEGLPAHLAAVERGWNRAGDEGKKRDEQKPILSREHEQEWKDKIPPFAVGSLAGSEKPFSKAINPALPDPPATASPAIVPPAEPKKPVIATSAPSSFERVKTGVSTIIKLGLHMAVLMLFFRLLGLLKWVYPKAIWLQLQVITVSMPKNSTGRMQLTRLLVDLLPKDSREGAARDFGVSRRLP